MEPPRRPVAASAAPGGASSAEGGGGAAVWWTSWETLSTMELTVLFLRWSPTEYRKLGPGLRGK